MIERHLAEAKQHVADGRAIVHQQRWIIAELEVLCVDTGPSRALLDTYLELLHLHESHRDRLREELLLSQARRSLLH